MAFSLRPRDRRGAAAPGAAPRTNGRAAPEAGTPQAIDGAEVAQTAEIAQIADPASPPDRKQRPEPSLKARALRFLAAREHSRIELARKLARHTEDADEIERVLDELGAKGWLSNQRFVESVVHRRSARLGTERIRQELRSHGIPAADAGSALDDLRASEGTRAYQLWLRRFGETAEEPEVRARQARFLIGRGFSAGIVQQIVRGAWQPDEADGEDAGPVPSPSR